MMFPARMSSSIILLWSLWGLQAAAQATGPQTVCLLKLAIDPKQSQFMGSGSTTAPIDGNITSTKLNATGHLWLRVPSTSSCPPKFTAENADDLLQQSSLEVPIGASSISFRPNDIKNKVQPLDPKAPPLANFDFLGLSMGLTGTEPLGPGTVTVGQGTVSEARIAAQRLCSQLVMLNGTLDLSSRLAGKRTADVQNVSFNRTVSAGVSVAKKGDGVSNATLYLSNVTLLVNISPETKEGQGTPGVEFSKATYSVSGNVVATADLNKATSWQSVPAEKVSWATVRRLDAPLVIGGNRPGKPRYIGDNSTIPQECKPTRVLDASGNIGAAAASEPGKRSASHMAGVSSLQGPLAVVLAVAMAGLLL